MLLACALALPASAAWDPFSYRQLPNSLDMMEAGLYWLQDMSRPTQAGDPATLLGAAEELAARQFDFAEMAWYTAGFDYLRQDILARSHYQHRLRDRLFAELARSLGMYDSLPPDMRVLPPLSAGVGQGLITVLVLRRHRPLQRLDFHLRYGSQGWRIVDVGNNGLLFSAYLREQGFH
jgi:ABC-type transporter MlaC component